jgi:hypothetical protein
VVDLSAGFSARQAEGLGEMADDNLQGAHDTSTAAEHDRPGYRETSALLEQAKQHVTETRVADLQRQLHVAAEAQEWQRVLDFEQGTSDLGPGSSRPGRIGHPRPGRDTTTTQHPPDSAIGVRAATQEGQAPTTYKTGDKVNGYVLGTDNLWHPLTRRQQPPQRGSWNDTLVCAGRIRLPVSWIWADESVGTPGSIPAGR